MNEYRSLENIIRSMANKQPTVPLLDDVEWRYSRLCNSIRKMYEQRNAIEKHEGDQLTVGTYRTKEFEQSPKAQLLFTSLPKDTSPADAEKCAILLDKLFALEKNTKASESATNQEVSSAEDLVKQIKFFADKMGLSQKMDFVDTSLQNIKKFAGVVPDMPIAKTDQEVEKLMKKTLPSPPFERRPDPKKDLDLDSRQFLIRRDLKAQRKIKIIDGD